MSPLVQKLAEQLQRLEQQVQQYDAKLSDNDKKWLARHSAFHDQLFDYQSVNLGGYLQVLRKDLKQIEQFEQLNARADTVELVCQRFANRFAALTQAIANSALIRQGTQVSAKATARRLAKKQAQKQDKGNPNHDEFYWIAKSALSSSHALYAELRQHQIWKNRIKDQISELEQGLGLQQGADKIKLQHEILETHKRLGRCRRAISYIEERIAYLERPNRQEY